MHGRVAIVTGGTRGIGAAVASRLALRGAKVCVTGRSQEVLDAFVRSTGEEDVVGLAGRADDVDHQNDVVALVMERFGRIDMLVNNVGINPTQGPLVELDLAAARKVVEVNCLAALSWVQKVHAASMRESGGAIVNVASVAALRPATGIGFYGASKAMLLSLTEQLALELAPTVRVNSVAPAVVKTRFASALYEAREVKVAAGYPMLRLGAPDDVAGAVTYLLSADAAWITGHCVVVDGGLTLSTG
jgi:NAD(P)-dependent dehydrogenase (short-subunit alcohol dehydrogenase family)